MVSSKELVDLLTLEKKSDQHYEGQNYKTPWGRVFGGKF